MLLREMAIFTLVVLCPGIGDCWRQACVNAISFHIYRKAGLLLTKTETIYFCYF